MKIDFIRDVHDQEFSVDRFPEQRIDALSR